MNMLLIVVSLSDIALGIRLNFAGGPIPALVLNTHLNREVLMAFSIGYFPTKAGPIVRGELNWRYLFLDEVSPYVQGGIGYTVITYNRRARHFRKMRDVTVVDLHFNGGVQWDIVPEFNLSSDIGLGYGIFMSHRVGRRNAPPIFPIFNLEGIYVYRLE